MENCGQIWNWDLDCMTDLEFDAFLDHAFLCGYHGTILTKYEKSAEPILDAIFSFGSELLVESVSDKPKTKSARSGPGLLESIKGYLGILLNPWKTLFFGGHFSVFASVVLLTFISTIILSSQMERYPWGLLFGEITASIRNAGNVPVVYVGAKNFDYRPVTDSTSARTVEAWKGKTNNENPTNQNAVDKKVVRSLPANNGINGSTLFPQVTPPTKYPEELQGRTCVASPKYRDVDTKPYTKYGIYLDPEKQSPSKNNGKFGDRSNEDSDNPNDDKDYKPIDQTEPKLPQSADPGDKHITDSLDPYSGS